MNPSDPYLEFVEGLGLAGSEDLVPRLKSQAQRDARGGPPSHLPIDRESFAHRLFVELLASAHRDRMRAALDSVPVDERERRALQLSRNADPARPGRGLDPFRWELPEVGSSDEALVSLLAAVKWMRAQETGLQRSGGDEQGRGAVGGN